MSKRTEQPYDTYTRAELTALIQSQNIEIGELQEDASCDFRFNRCEVFPVDFRSDVDDSNGQQWSVAWSDLMMTMFIFFVILYCYQISFHPPVWGEVAGSGRASAMVGGERLIKTTTTDPLAGPAGQSLATMYKEGRMALQEKDLGSFAALDLVGDKAMRVSLSGDLLFAQGGSELLPRARYFLLDLLPLLRLAPYHIEVIGHADESALETSYADGWDLSLKRATKVARILMDSGGLDPKRFAISGVGAMDPVRDNMGAVEQASNRRVEIILTLGRREDPISVVKPLKSVL